MVLYIFLHQTDNTIESFASSVPIQISGLIKRYRPSFMDIHWPDWTNRIRPRVSTCFEDVEKCKSPDKGFITLSCPNCNTTARICFTCKRKICSSCSKPLCDKRVNRMNSWLPTNIPYMHITFTLPEELRFFRLEYRDCSALSLIAQQALKVILNFFKKKFGIEPWVFSVIHTFGSYVNRNPHLHFITTLWWFDIDRERVSVEGKYISFRAIKTQRRAFLIKECRVILEEHPHLKTDSHRKQTFKNLFKKSRYVTLSEPIFEVSYVMSYVTRYMYRPPVSLTKIINCNLTDDINDSSITLKYFHKKPHEERIITYSMFEFMWLIARQLPDKYFRVVRYWWFFAPNKKAKALEKLKTIPLADTKIIHKNKVINTDCKVNKSRPISYQNRLMVSFGKDPFECPCCKHHMIKTSITYWSKKDNSFFTKYFNSS